MALIHLAEYIGGVYVLHSAATARSRTAADTDLALRGRPKLAFRVLSGHPKNGKYLFSVASRLKDDLVFTKVEQTGI